VHLSTAALALAPSRVGAYFVEVVHFCVFFRFFSTRKECRFYPIISIMCTQYANSSAS